MRLFYYRGIGGAANFGDELNPYLWSRLLPDLDTRGSHDWIFVGIGTLLNDRLPKAGRTIVFGAGVGYGEAVPKPDDRWRIHFVRGPRSAAALGIGGSAALTDPAILVSDVWQERRERRRGMAFMPHFSHANSWIESLCQEEGIGYIDPRWPVERVLTAIADSDLLLAEAMHGAIVADALRVPWIPVRSAPSVLEFKWLDWCDSIQVPYRPQTTVSLWSPVMERPFAKARAWAKATVLGRQLKRIARGVAPCLSTDDTWRRLREAVARRLDEFKHETEPMRVREVDADV
jgi:succinoglycan biosynthesis protein ExoV